MMAYSQRFVVTVLVDGKIRKELNDGTVELPFDSEYALRFRNKHRNRRAVVKLFIDGEEQSKNGYVIPPNGYVDIERNSYSPRKFLFVAPDSTEAQDFGKDPENKERLNGMIEARFYLEKERPVVKEVHHHHHHHPAPNPWYGPRRDIHHNDCYPSVIRIGDAVPKTETVCGGYTSSNSAEPSIQACGGMSAAPQESPDATPATMGFHSKDAEYSGGEIKHLFESEAKAKGSDTDDIATFKRISIPLEKTVTPGVTVEGGYSSQQFHAVDIDLEDQFVAIKVLLKGFQREDTVEEAASENPSQGPGVVADDGYCSNCGARRKPPKARFCHVCGHKY